MIDTHDLVMFECGVLLAARCSIGHLDRAKMSHPAPFAVTALSWQVETHAGRHTIDLVL